MSKSNAQSDPVEEWMSDAKHRLKIWGAYYRNGFSGCWYSSETVIGKLVRGGIQQPLNTGKDDRIEECDQTDAIISALPKPLTDALVDYYGLKRSVRQSAKIKGMNHHAYRQLLDRAESGVATGLSVLAVRTENA